ncbi:MAG: phenylalanine--tRNA ligase subunit beta, partial [Bacteroidales bacterium]|nr:phenylalanine--tRNA ligase subunit beta [Bacteroidales bacterium]
IAGGIISSEIQDIDSGRYKKARINLNYLKATRLMGRDIGRNRMKSILSSLGFMILGETENELSVEVPLNRVDVLREADVVEEILRIYGYNNVKIPAKINASVSPGKKPDRAKLQTLISTSLSANGFYEIISNSLTRQDYYTENPDFSDGKTVQILNPLSRDLGVLRRTLLYGVLEAILFNMNRKSFDLSLFEFGKSYVLTGKQSDEISEKFKEENLLALALTGKTQKESWTGQTGSFTFFHLKDHIERVLRKLNISSGLFVKDDCVPAYFDYGICYYHNDNQLIIAGKVADRLLRRMDIDQEVFYSEIKWDLLIDIAGQAKTTFAELPKFPEVRRDIAMLLDKQVAYQTIEEIAFTTEKKLLREVSLFDVYEGANIEAGKKSYAVSFILQDPEKTLTDKVIEKTMQRLRAAFEKEMDARIR